MKKMNHAEYMAKVKAMPYNQLLFTARDARDAAAAYPGGENAGYYLDEMNYCAAELHRRDEAVRKACREHLRK